MTADVAQNSSEVVTPVPTELLELLHATGVALEEHPDSLWRRWGRHLLDDWRALDVLLEKRP